MLDAISYEEMIRRLNKESERERETIGILISQPTSDFVKNEILSRIEYYYMRSFDNIDFYFPGYGAYWPIQDYPDKQDICEVNNTMWSYSTKSFIDFIDELESRSNYKYSGETELIIIDYVDGKLDFSSTLIFWLDRMVKDDAIYSVPNFFEQIFRLFRSNKNTFIASDVLALNSLARGLLNNGLDLLPGTLGNTFIKTKYFCTRRL